MGFGFLAGWWRTIQRSNRGGAKVAKEAQRGKGVGACGLAYHTLSTNGGMGMGQIGWENSREPRNSRRGTKGEGEVRGDLLRGDLARWVGVGCRDLERWGFSRKKAKSLLRRGYEGQEGRKKGKRGGWDDEKRGGSSKRFWAEQSRGQSARRERNGSDSGVNHPRRDGPSRPTFCTQRGQEWPRPQ